jgi:hypothetical protein
MVHVPRQLVRAMGLRKGDLLAVTAEAGRVILKRMDEDALAAAESPPVRHVAVEGGGG